VDRYIFTDFYIDAGVGAVEGNNHKFLVLLVPIDNLHLLHVTNT